MTGKPLLLFLGRCQAQWLSDRLFWDPEARLQYEVVVRRLEKAGREQVLAQPLEAGQWQRCAVLFLQVNPGMDVTAILAQLPSGCRVFRFPGQAFRMLWPFHRLDPRPWPGLAFWTGPFEYGDRLVVQLRDRGLTGAGAVQAYLDTDITQLVDLDRLAEIQFHEARTLDALSDVQIAPFMDKHWRDHRLFVDIDHPTHHMLSPIVAAMRAFLTEDAAWLEEPPGQDKADAFHPVHIPVHPQVAEHFHLTWAPPERQYRFENRLLTFRQYLEGSFSPEALYPAEGGQGELLLALAEQGSKAEDRLEGVHYLTRLLLEQPGTPALAPLEAALGALEPAQAAQACLDGVQRSRFYAGGPRPLLLACGDHQAQLLLEALRRVPGLNQAFQLLHCPSDGSRPPSPGQWQRCTHLLLQAPGQASAIREHLAPGTRVWRFPQVELGALWPFHGPDPRPGWPGAGGRFPFGDRLALQCLQETRDPGAALALYLGTDCRRLLDLDQLVDQAFQSARAWDLEADLPMAPFLESEWTRHQLFYNKATPAPFLLAPILRAALAFLGWDPALAAGSPAPCSELYEIPVHPQVAEALALAWAPAGRRYQVHAQCWDFPTFLEAYLHGAIPLEATPELWLRRSGDLLAAGRPRAAGELLGQAVTRQPRTHLRQAWTQALAQAGPRERLNIYCQALGLYLPCAPQPLLEEERDHATP